MNRFIGIGFVLTHSMATTMQIITSRLFQYYISGSCTVGDLFINPT